MMKENSFMQVPTVLKRTSDGERAYDLMSRLLEDRIIMFNSEVNSDSAQIAISELLYLASVDDSKDITMYINSPGGSVVDGLAQELENLTTVEIGRAHV